MVNKILIHPTYFPNLGHFIALWNADEILLEINDFFDKQTYRNRMYFLGANGKHMLSVPVRHSKSLQRRPTKDILISHEAPWQHYHWKSLETAYRSSPYFEFYEDDLRPLFEQKFDRLIDLNVATIQKVFDWLGKPFRYRLTNEWAPRPPEGYLDLRYLVDAKKTHDYVQHLTSYIQVFSDRHPFVPDLSILDLLFMEGPAAAGYLDKHKDLLFARVGQ